VILAATLTVLVIGFGEKLQEDPTFAVLEVDFYENETSAGDAYSEFLWEIEVTHTGGQTIDADDIVVHLDHGDQRLTGEINQSITAGETLTLNIVHNQIDHPNFNCGETNVACRLAGDPGNYPDNNEVRLLMIDEESNTILEEETIAISGDHGIYNGASGPDIGDETFIFA
jgi:FlaG/FlaF family flagellin (archaellin)